jgi:hypothetical protein
MEGYFKLWTLFKTKPTPGTTILFFKLPDACTCTICNRQPPSLHDIASHSLFSGRLRYFKLTANTTYQEYVRAAMSHNLETERLLPPEYPSVRVWCRFDMFSHKFHHDCPGQGTWHTEMVKNIRLMPTSLKILWNWKKQCGAIVVKRDSFFQTTVLFIQTIVSNGIFFSL